MIRLALVFTLFLAFPVWAQQGSADPLWGLYKQGQFEEVAQQGKALLNTGTDTAQINLAVGRALADLGQLDEAMPYLVRAVKADPDHSWVYAWAQIYLGNCHSQKGELEQAGKAWKLGRDCGATRNATRTAVGNLRVLGLDEYFGDWITFESEHFSFRFSPRLGVFDRAAYARAREEAYANISSWFGGGPDRKIRFFVWADHAEAGVAGMPPLGFAKPANYLIHAHVQQTRGHEITHVISHHALHPIAKAGLVNEGIAIVHDQTGRDTMLRAQEAVAKGLAGHSDEPFIRVELRALWEDFELLSPEYSYPIAGAFVAHILTAGGKEKFMEFFPDQTFEHAKVVYGKELETWIEDFEAQLYDD